MNGSFSSTLVVCIAVSALGMAGCLYDATPTVQQSSPGTSSSGTDAQENIVLPDDMPKAADVSEDRKSLAEVRETLESLKASGESATPEQIAKIAERIETVTTRLEAIEKRLKEIEGK